MPRSTAWFDGGYRAFSSTFPTVAAKIGSQKFYVCPICLSAYSEKALEVGALTREDVPPRSVGGRPVVLTCESCNSEGGHSADHHAAREAVVFNFAAGDLAEIRAHVVTSSGRLPIRLSAAGNGILAFGVPQAVSPAEHQKVMADFDASTDRDRAQDFKMTFEFPEFSADRARSSWLRSAYLAFFAALGYRFICRREMDIVRNRIRHPELDTPATFRIIRPEPSVPRLFRIDEPAVFRAYIMLYGRNEIFLPRYNDFTLYQRLAEHPETEVTLSGIEYPWPTRPVFLHDQPVPNHGPVAPTSLESK
jgi:hypothetical protein